ncbi:lactaldehyde dehydrogenase/glycolaldehyde dehydrogenase [Salsuginibacillus halophilus]|uniref:3-sulfolactaldehyde dehydrogenase n=1 Tax=Salsuginibacillus halophilus TaxID=517424 RepID=A0A2P8HXT5_9BACI|nr:aldehyde dehydrogenase [Salsuginibacillus halophilus]PSL50984.1 lactaldehyde dehydrogenase/glycolaldehyde dehydrogenase [Salsuginibacillus halophilus]
MKQIYVNGQFQNATTDEKIQVVNPATEEFISEVPKAGEQDVNQAISAAKQVQSSWEKKPPVERAEYALSISRSIKNHKQTLQELLMQEQGKTESMAEAELDMTIDYFSYMAGFARHLEGDVIPSDRPNETMMLIKKPIGIVGGVVPWNFPLMVLARKAAPAIVTGCPVIIKPSQETPLTALKLAEIIHDEVELPAGTFQVITGSGSSVGTPLASHPDVAMISLTGSFAAGSKVMEAAAKHVIKVNLELGGKAPAIVSDEADLDLAVEKVIASRVVNSGQVCTNAERVYVHENVAEPFIQKLTEKMSKVSYGNPLAETGLDMGPLINKEQLDSVEQAVNQAVEAGAKVETGGQKGEASTGYYYEPTVLTNLEEGMDILASEIFGPVLPVDTYQDFDEVIRRANASDYGLSSSIFTKNYNEVMRAVNELKFGEVFVNREHFEALQGFHAGWRKSGIGGADGKYGIEEFLGTTVAYMEYSTK